MGEETSDDAPESADSSRLHVGCSPRSFSLLSRSKSGKGQPIRQDQDQSVEIPRGMDSSRKAIILILLARTRQLFLQVCGF